jgi:autotransporter-associated beta strand protein
MWDVDADGQWTNPNDWTPSGVPGNPGDAALLGVGSALRTITLNNNESLGYLSMTNAQSFVINGSSTLTFDNNQNGAYVTVSAGAQNAINTPVALNDNTTVLVSGSDSLAFSGVVANSPSAAKTLTFASQGTVIMGKNNTYGPPQGQTGTTLINGTLQVNNNGSLSAGDLSVGGNSTLLSGAQGLTLTNNINIASGVMLTVNDNGNMFALGGVVGNGSGGDVTKIGGGTVTMTNNNGYGSLLVSNGTLVLSGQNYNSGGPVTNNATLQLANAEAVLSALTMNSGSTLQLRGDIPTSFSLSSLAVPNASDTLNFDVGPITSGVTGQTLTLGGGTLAFGYTADQNINVTGNSTYTLALPDITLTSGVAGGAGTHNPYVCLNVNTLPTGAAVTIASVTSGAWGNDLNLKGGGNVTIEGTLGNISNGSLDLFVNGGTTVTLLSSTVKNATGDGYRYEVENGTLVLDSSTALINDSTGAGLNTSYFILGAESNVYYITGTTAPAVGVLVTNNNSYNAAVYLGDANNSSGGLSVSADVTNYVSDGDVGFTNSGVFTIGGQNTSGVNTYNNPIILGMTPNIGKSVTLVAATGGEVDFTGGILANGTDTTAGITAGNATFGGIVKLFGANTYGGSTIISNGTLALANNGTMDASIGNSGTVFVNAGAILDVTAQSSGTFTVDTGMAGQTLLGSGSINGNLTVGSLGTLEPGSATATGTLTVSGNTVLGGVMVMKLNMTGSQNCDKLACSTVTGGGTLTVTNIGPGLVTNTIFQLFGQAVTGFAQVNLPLTDGNGYTYTWNNKLAQNGSIVVVTSVAPAPPVNTNPATAHFNGVLVGNALQFSWAPDHEGWQLYTNAVGLTATNSWFPVPGSASVTNESITINRAVPTVFFELRYP